MICCRHWRGRSSSAAPEMTAIESGSYTEFSRNVHVNALRVPINATIEVSHRCPLNCAHCYNNLPMGDAAARETYETLTRIPGSYDRCMRGVRILLERKLPLALKTVGVTINKHEVGAMRKIAEDLGVEFKFDAMLNPRIDCSSSPLAVRLAPHDVVELDLEDPQKVSEWRR